MEILKDGKAERIEEFIRKIVLDILKETGYSETSEKKEESKVPQRRPESILVVFTGGTGSLDVVIEQLGKLSVKYKLYAIFSEAAKKILPQEKLKKIAQLEEVHSNNLYEIINECRVVILPTLTQNTAAKIVHGIRDTIATETVAVALMMEKKILACKDSLPSKVKCEGYMRVINDIIQKLNEFGVALCEAQKMSEEVEALIGRNISVSGVSSTSMQQSITEDKQKEITIDSKLITVETIRRLYDEGVRKINLPDKCIITPAAMDIIKDYKIALSRRA